MPRKKDPPSEPQPNPHTPQPDPSRQYKAEDLVWVWSATKPYWPAQVREQTVMEHAISNRTRNSSPQIAVIKFGFRTEREKERTMVPTKCVLPWDDAEFEKVGEEFNQRTGHNSLEDWDEAMFAKWDLASEQANEEHLRLMRKEESARKEHERKQREQKIQERDNKLYEKYHGKIYDNRHTDANGQMVGHEIRAGYTIRFRVDINVIVGADYIQPQVVEVYDMYKIKRRNSPLRVGSIQQPDWDTEVEIIDPPHDGIFALRDCRFVPGEDKDVLTVGTEVKHLMVRREDELRKMHPMMANMGEQRRRRERRKIAAQNGEALDSDAKSSDEFVSKKSQDRQKRKRSSSQSKTRAVKRRKTQSKSSEKKTSTIIQFFGPKNKGKSSSSTSDKKKSKAPPPPKAFDISLTQETSGTDQEQSPFEELTPRHARAKRRRKASDRKQGRSDADNSNSSVKDEEEEKSPRPPRRSRRKKRRLGAKAKDKKVMLSDESDEPPPKGMSRKRSYGEVNGSDDHGSEDDDAPVRKKQRIAPTQPLRRSNRKKRRPAKFGTYGYVSKATESSQTKTMSQKKSKKKIDAMEVDDVEGKEASPEVPKFPAVRSAVGFKEGDDEMFKQLGMDEDFEKMKIEAEMMDAQFELDPAPVLVIPGSDLDGRKKKKESQENLSVLETVFSGMDEMERSFDLTVSS